MGQVFFSVGGAARLSISYLPAFPYDGGGSRSEGKFELADEDRARLTFNGEDIHIPPLLILPGSDFFRVEISAREMAGEVDFQTGLIELQFDAVFTPCLGKIRRTPISVVTTLTTETSQGLRKKLTGQRLDPSGRALLVGVAVVPKTGDRFTDLFLNLPADAASELPARFEFVRAEGE